MPEPQLFEAAKLVGIAFPLVMILIWQLQLSEKRADKATAERMEITRAFLAAQKEMLIKGSEGDIRVAATLTEITQNLRDRAAASSAEHVKQLELLQELILLVRQIAGAAH